MIGWIFSWLLFAASTAVVWECALREPPTPRGLFARAILVLLGVLLLMGVTILVDLWGGIAHHAWTEYPWRFARKLMTFAALGLSATAAFYIWFANRVLHWAWPQILSWFSDPQWSEQLRTTRTPTLAEIGLLLVVTAVLAWRVLRRAGRQPLYAYSHAVEVLGWRKLALGIGLMSYLRLLVPRRDFILQAPIFSWMPLLAVAAIAHELISIPVFSVAIPALMVALWLPFWLNVIAPPLWMFLGTSETQSFFTFWEIRQTWRRHGMTLLDRTSQGGQQLYDAWRAQIKAPSQLFHDPSIGRVWSLRTRPGVWTIAVRLLAAFVPVIVVDWRDPSEIVKFEAQWLVSHGFAEKAYFVAPVGGLVTSADVPPGGTLVREEQLIAAQWDAAGLTDLEPS